MSCGYVLMVLCGCVLANQLLRWPDKLHATLIQNRSGDMGVVELYYDFVRGFNLNVISALSSRGDPLFDLELQNGSTYYFRPSDASACKRIDMGVGILRPDWLEGADYLGEEKLVLDTKTLVAEKWSQGERPDGKPGVFITYWNDKETQTPIKWTFFDNAEFFVIRWEPGVGPEDDSIYSIPQACWETQPTHPGQGQTCAKT